MVATTAYKTQPQPNLATKGVSKAHAFQLTDDVYILAADGTPVNGVAGTGTGGGWANIGSLYIDKVGGKVYINTGTKASPVWTVVGTQT